MHQKNQNLRVVSIEQGLELLQLPVLQDNYIYILHDHSNQLTAVIDPAAAEPVINCLEARGWKLDFIWNTHHHDDHIGGNKELKQRYGSRVLASRYDRHRIPSVDQLLDDGNDIAFGAWTVQVFSTPGHTLGHCVYFLPKAHLLFCGDTLFSMGCGRLFEGSPEQMWNSLKKIRDLPADTTICCTHEYTLSNARYAESLPKYSAGLEGYIYSLQGLRAENRPTVPALLLHESQFNPFLQADRPAMQKALGLKGSPAAEVFAVLRSGKDFFKG